jgi:hypothetical protein
MLLASRGFPGCTETAVAVVAAGHEMFTFGVPVRVNPVCVPVPQSVPLAPIHLILPAPKAIERVLEFDELKNPVVSVRPLRSMVPFVNVVVCVDTTVNAS